MNRRLLLVDGNNLAARSFHAMPELSSDAGRTGAIYGFIKGLSWCRYQTKTPLFQTVVFWDGGRSAHRMSLYPDYKGNRSMEKAEREDYRRQIKVIREMLTYSGCRQVKVDGVEADDLISIFCGFLKEQGDNAVIYSADGDFHQLYAKNNVLIFDPKKEILALPDLQRKWNVPLNKIVLKKALVGDSSDNIKGVPSIGDKRATLVCAYLGIRHKPHQKGFPYKVYVEKDGWTEKDGKWIDLALERNNKMLINRNIELMRLPQNWEDSHYGDEEALSALEQWLDQPKKKRRKFIELLGRYEMDSILENLANW